MHTFRAFGNLSYGHSTIKDLLLRELNWCVCSFPPSLAELYKIIHKQSMRKTNQITQSKCETVVGAANLTENQHPRFLWPSITFSCWIWNYLTRIQWLKSDFSQSGHSDLSVLVHLRATPRQRASKQNIRDPLLKWNAAINESVWLSLSALTGQHHVKPSAASLNHQAQFVQGKH